MATIEGSIDGVPSFHDLPIMKDQIRIALRNCGHIDPTDVYQYIANGGFEALDKALTGMTPQEVLQQVKDSGLRGRGGAAFHTGIKWGFLAGSASPVPRRSPGLYHRAASTGPRSAPQCTPAGSSPRCTGSSRSLAAGSTARGA